MGGLVEKAGLLETFGITLGADMQKDPLMKLPIAGLFKGLLELNTMVKAGGFYIPLMTEQGREALGKLKEEKIQS